MPPSNHDSQKVALEIKSFSTLSGTKYSILYKVQSTVLQQCFESSRAGCSTPGPGFPEFINETALTFYPQFGGGHGRIQLSVQHGFFSVINWQIPSRNSGLQAQEHCRPDQTKMSGYLLPSI